MGVCRSRRPFFVNDYAAGGAIAVMTSEISRLERSILLAKAEATAATRSLSDEIDRAKEERAFWTLQKKFAETGPVRPARLQRRRRRAEAGLDA